MIFKYQLSAMSTVVYRACLCVGLRTVCSCASGGSESESGGDVSPSGPIESVADLRARLQHVWCETLPACCAKQDIDFSDAGCREAIAAYVDGSGTFVGDVWDAEAAEVCVQKSLAAAQACETAEGQLEEVQATCETVLRSSVGLPCILEHNCAPDESGPTECFDRVCRLSITAEAGQACGEFPERIVRCDEEADLFCNAGTCEAAARQGDDCRSRPCASRLFCNPPPDGELCCPECAPRVPEGEPCTTDVAAECVEGTQCDSETKTCITFDPPDCGDVSCGEREYCDRAELTCRPKLSDGEHCGSAYECLGGRCECRDASSCSTPERRCFKDTVPSFCWAY